MSPALFSALIFLGAGAVGVMLWLVARSLREYLRMRLPLDQQRLPSRDTSQEPSTKAIKGSMAPPGLPTEGVGLGHNVYGGKETPIYLTEADRRRHLYLIGQPGTGKNNLFFNMILQDMRAGRGVGVVDPRGELIEDLLLHVPPARRQDVILFDPQDTQRPLGFNVLTVRDEAEKEIVINEVVKILHQLAMRLSPESKGSAFTRYLDHALLAVMEDRQATLLDVPRLFIDRDFRAAIVAHSHNPVRRQFWEQEFERAHPGQLVVDRLRYVMSKLGRFMNNSVMRNIIGQENSPFDLQEIMDQQKILLVNLAPRSLGNINSDLLGAVLVAKMQMAAGKRASLPESAGATFYLYLDEWQNFTTDSMTAVLSGAGQYPLSLNLTHQFTQPLDAPVQKAIFDNVGTIVSYQVGEQDATALAPLFAPIFSEYDLLNLERFTAYVRLLVKGVPQPPFSLRPPLPPAYGDAAGRDAIRMHSRTIYGRLHSQVEEEILQRLQLGATRLHHTSLPEPQAAASSVQVR
ncbi:MAG: hypothetical protein WEA04_01930 [Candidatus Andersenbacteria bacterium]